MSFVKLWPYDDGDTFPAIVAGNEVMLPCQDTLFECWLPDAIENDEYAMVILYKNMPILTIASHFDFVKSYYINTSKGVMNNDKGEIEYFTSRDDARQHAINYADLSDRSLEILEA